MTKKLTDLFVENPIKKEVVSDTIEIDGTFSCQQCSEQADVAKMAEGKIFWKCAKCGFNSVVNGLG